MSVRRLLTEMDSREISHWMARHYYVEPLPDPWYMNAAIQKTIADCTPELKRKPKLKDFIPAIYTEPEEGSAEQNLAIMKQIAAAMKPT